MQEFIESLYEDIMKMSSGLIVKRQDIADKNETADSAKNYDRYLALMSNKRYFFNFATYDLDILQDILPADLVGACYVNPNLIPEEYRILIMDRHYTRYYTNYVELNNYYRMLNGLPDVDDNAFIYITNVDGIDPLIPIHLQPDEVLISLYYNGKMSELISLYPSKTYLNHLGHKQVDIFTARKAKHFEILYTPEPKTQISKDLFLKEYYTSRNFHMSTLYAKHVFRMNDVFDGMFGMMILVGAIRSTLSVDQNSIMTNEAIERMLQSYGLGDYFISMPIVYKKRLIKNIDKLIAIKGTDQVLIDICDIFGYNNITANRYYLYKTHAKDEYDQPIFPKNQDGSIDYDSMYELDFLKSDISKDYIQMVPENVIPYSSVTENDPLWQLSTQELSDFKKMEFNLMMTKYVGVEAAYNVTELVFETSYFMNLMLDSRNNSKLMIMNSYSASSESDTFTALIFLFSAMSKLAGFDGNILVEPAQVAQIYRYNLNVMKSTLEGIISSYNLSVTADEVMLNKPIGIFDDAQYLTNIYIKNTAIYDMISNLMKETSSYHEFQGLKELRDVLFLSAQNQEIFKKSNGEVALTYIELLEDIDNSLSIAINSAQTDTELENMITYVLMNLQSLFDTDVLEFLFINTPDMHDKLIKNHFKNMVNLFKATSVQIGNIDIFFKITDSGNPMRSFCEYFTDSVYEYDHYAVQSRDEVGTNTTVYLNDRCKSKDSVTYTI